MEIQVRKPKQDKTVTGHLRNAQALYEELLILHRQIQQRLKERGQAITNLMQAIQSKGIPKPTMHYRHHSGEGRDKELSLYAKSFTFVARQFTDELILAARKGGLKCKSGSHSDNELARDFNKFFEALCNQDTELIGVALPEMKAQRDSFILMRLMRNAVKESCFVDCHFLNGKATLVVYLPKNDHMLQLLNSDKLREKAAAGVDYFKVHPEFFSEVLESFQKVLKVFDKESFSQKAET